MNPLPSLTTLLGRVICCLEFICSSRFSEHQPGPVCLWLGAWVGGGLERTDKCFLLMKRKRTSSKAWERVCGQRCGCGPRNELLLQSGEWMKGPRPVEGRGGLD